MTPNTPALFSVAWFDAAIASNQANADNQQILWHKALGVVDALKAQREMAVQAETPAVPSLETQLEEAQKQNTPVE